VEEVSVIVCVKNSETTIERCLQSIARNHPAEILVVDGNSHDRTLEIAQRYTNKIISDGGKGLAYARQLGAELSQGNHVMYIDSDVELPKDDTIANLLRDLKERKWNAIHATVVDPREDISFWEQGEDLYWQYRVTKAGEKDILPTLCCLIEKSLVLENKFDPFFTGAVEDSDFFFRIRRLGHTFGCSSEEVYHYHRATLHEFLKQKVWFGKGNANFFWKHRKPIILFVPALLVLDGAQFCVRSKKINLLPYFFLWSLAYSWGFLVGLQELVINVERKEIAF